jgi:hypothetical protein
MNEAEFWAALAPQPAPPEPSYRLYYDEQGLPLFYSMEDKPGNYIELDSKTYAESPAHVRIVDGKLVHLKINVVHKLHPGDVGTPCDPTDVTIIVREDQEHIKWSLK